jgi:flagellar biosynthesis protein FliQ
MKKLLVEVFQELALVFTGKSMDILLPPIVFLILHSTVSLLVALIGSLILSLFFFIKRVNEKENLFYALGGIIGVSVAIALVYINDNAASFFLPDIIGTSFLIFITVGSLVLKKPLALWVSHITRGWKLEWFYRKDVKPAYTEVTIFWLFFFITRLSIEVYLYTSSSIEELIFANIILGYPLLITVLTISYIYGITRLRILKGPGIDEFTKNALPPYRGQTRGF